MFLERQAKNFEDENEIGERGKQEKTGGGLHFFNSHEKRINKIMHFFILLSNKLNTALDQEAAMQVPCLVCKKIEDVS